jgi:glucan phosphorylase
MDRARHPSDTAIRASHSRFALLDPWEADRAEEKEAGRCAREVQRQPAGQGAGYGCVEWYRGVLNEFLQEARDSCFSVAVAVRTQIPAYARGRGMLAGDGVRFAADLALPLGGVTLR